MRSPYGLIGVTRRFSRRKTLTLPDIVLAESRMLKFLGSTVGIIFLIGLVVVILLLKFIF
jgi:hypothetical protein